MALVDFGICADYAAAVADARVSHDRFCHSFVLLEAMKRDTGWK